MRYRVSDSAWFTMIALNMSLTILFPMIDWAAHVVGAVTGVQVDTSGGQCSAGVYSRAALEVFAWRDSNRWLFRRTTWSMR